MDWVWPDVSTIRFNESWEREWKGGGVGWGLIISWFWEPGDFIRFIPLWSKMIQPPPAVVLSVDAVHLNSYLLTSVKETEPPCEGGTRCLWVTTTFSPGGGLNFSALTELPDLKMHWRVYEVSRYDDVCPQSFMFQHKMQDLHKKIRSRDKERKVWILIINSEL